MIYIDDEFKCHVENPACAYQAVENEFFDGKCDEMIEGYRFIPAGYSWTRFDGVVFQGEMIAPLVDYDLLDSAQRKYERAAIAEYESLINELYSEVTAE